MFRLISGIFLGWSLGANDSANVFGTAVASYIVKFSIAATITAIGVIVGSVLQGAEGMGCRTCAPPASSRPGGRRQ